MFRCYIHRHDTILSASWGTIRATRIVPFFILALQARVSFKIFC